MKKAFSLLEISIALTIISAILVITLNGQKALNNYEIKHISSQIEEYANALKAFYDIYQQIPGDSSNGYNLFGDKYCSNKINSAAYDSGCNGNGNGNMDLARDEKNIDARETILAWYHLYKAEIVKFNNQNQIFNSSNPRCQKFNIEIGKNIPPLKIRNAGILISKYQNNAAGDSITLHIIKGQDCYPDSYSGIFTLAELSIIDKKYDNEDIASGNMVSTHQACLNPQRSYISSNCDLSYSFILH